MWALYCSYKSNSSFKREFRKKKGPSIGNLNTVLFCFLRGLMNIFEILVQYPRYGSTVYFLFMHP